MTCKTLFSALSPLAILLASCGAAPPGESAATPTASRMESLAVQEMGRFAQPWAMAFLPGGHQALVSERAGKLMLWQSGAPPQPVSGVPGVDYGGQGGLGDVVLSPRFAQDRTIYLSWVEASEGDTRGAVVGRAMLIADGAAPRLEGLEVIWRQAPKVTGRGHYSHRLAFSPDGQSLYIASGDRQKMAPAQDRASDLGKIFRVPLANPAAREVVSLGHRNMLGLSFDARGRLWVLEHGPKGGDELNLVQPGGNYGWPLVSDGDHYDGRAIPRHATSTDFIAPAISWTPVIAPGGMIFYSGTLFPDWRGQAVIAGLGSQGLVRVRIEGETAREVARHPLGNRIRAIAQHPDGSIWVLEDADNARLLRLAPAR